MTSLSKLIAGSVVAAALVLPIANVASAVSYESTYTCYHRNVSGNCMNYQTSMPYYGAATYRTSSYMSPYVYGQYDPYAGYQPSSMYPSYYEEDDDDNTYYDDDDDSMNNRYYDSRDGTWMWYVDEDDYTRPYLFQSGNRNGNYSRSMYRRGGNYESRYEYEHTRILCEGRNCEEHSERF